MSDTDAVGCSVRIADLVASLRRERPVAALRTRPKCAGPSAQVLAEPAPRLAGIRSAAGSGTVGLTKNVVKTVSVTGASVNIQPSPPGVSGALTFTQ
jgi:hypothetical protein